jgi:hypothetical protein
MTFVHALSRLALASLAALLASCALEQAEAPSDEPASTAATRQAVAPPGNYYITSSWNGDVGWVKAVNGMNGGLLTQCADGVMRPTCKVTEVDYHMMPLNPAQQAALHGAFRNGKAVLSGAMGMRRGAPVLGVLQAWVLQARGDGPTGSFYFVVDRHAWCLRAPCASIEEDLLNTNASRMIVGVNMAAAGAGAAVLAAADAALHGPGLVVAGTNVPLPNGVDVTLKASELYTPFP